MAGLNGRVQRLEQTLGAAGGVCAACGGERAPTLADLLDAARAGRPVCACAPSWRAALRAALDRPAPPDGA